MPGAMRAQLPKIASIALTLAGCGGGASPPPPPPPPPGVDAAVAPPVDAARDAGPDLTPPSGPGRFAGVWSGDVTARPVSFVVSEDGTITDVAVRFLLSYNGAGCNMTFHPTAPATIADDKVHVELKGPTANFLVPMDLTFGANDVTISTAGFSGAYQIRCAGPDTSTGTGLVLGPLAGRATRIRAITNPEERATKITGAAGRPLVIGSFDSACSNQAGSTRDRWCGFARAGANGAGELWVFNASRVAAGDGVSCEVGAERNCVRLTDALWIDMETTSTLRHPSVHRFVGDTLLFFANATSAPAAAFSGDVMVWRPDWPAPAKLTDGSAGACVADATSDAVLCFENYGSTPALGLQVELSATKLGDGSAVSLRYIDTLLLLTSQESLMRLAGRYSTALSPGGEYLLWSARPDETPAAQETLHVLKLGDPINTQRVLAKDVSSWRVSTDGRKLFWVKGALYPPLVSTPGILEVVDFPSGANPKALEAQVAQYLEVPRPAPGTPGVVLRNAQSQLRYWPDREGAGPEVTLDPARVATMRRLDIAGNFLTYSKTTTADGRGDLNVVALNPPGPPCNAVPTAEAVSSPVLSSSGRYVVVSTSPSDEARVPELLIFESATCARTKLADRPYAYLRTSGDRAVATADNLPLRRFGLSSLLLYTPGASGKPETLQPTAAGPLGLLERANGQTDILFTIDAGWRTDGIYLQTLPR
jgi:hypothetical protein